MLTLCFCDDTVATLHMLMKMPANAAAPKLLSVGGRILQIHAVALMQLNT